MPQLLLYSLIRKYAIPCCHQHTMILYIACRLWCSLIWTFHMDWLQTRVTSESLSIGHTTIVHTPCINIEISVVVGIVPLPQYTHANSSYVQGSPCTLCPKTRLQYLVIWTYLMAYQRWGMTQGHKKLPHILLCMRQ